MIEASAHREGFMLENSVVSTGLKLNELAEFEVGTGVILLTLKDAGKSTQGVTYVDLREAMRVHLGGRLERYGIKAPERIVERLLAYLEDTQSVFTMAAH
jgi:hypothetical protein